MNTSNIKPLTIKELVSNDQYRIPIYQRNYDWGEREIKQLIEDIYDYASTSKDKKYYIGSLVVFERNSADGAYFEAIDGQQRLTTLNILLQYLSNIDNYDWYRGINITYDYRSEADEQLRSLKNASNTDLLGPSSIADAYKTIKKAIEAKFDKGDDKITRLDFVDYLLNNVIIMRIPVPRDTELNHYFEIMNSRGEQLEKHEVLKANLMNHFDEDSSDERELFNLIWEACSDMNRYVQMNFDANIRTKIFSDSWETLNFHNFDDLLRFYRESCGEGQTSDDDYQLLNINQIINKSRENSSNPFTLPSSDSNDFEAGSDRFGSVINFPNFLLQVLKIVFQDFRDRMGAEFNTIDKSIKLDDKRLIEIFDNVLRHLTDKTEFVKAFIVGLLRLRYLADRYIIKREYHNGNEAWSIKRLKKYDKSKVNYVCTFGNTDTDDTDDNEGSGHDILMLESMFHVSAPTQIYKHWLNSTLYYINQHPDAEPAVFRDYLYDLARKYMTNRYMCSKKIDFEDFIYSDGFSRIPVEYIDWNNINDGCSVENFIFNFYDYLLWSENKSRYSNFEFTYRTSVEHFYPQTPQEGHEKLTKETGLHDFGNLCLIGRGMNSKFSNNMPKAKYDNFSTVMKTLSIKLQMMMEHVRNHEWSTKEINEFGVEATERFRAVLTL